MERKMYIQDGPVNSHGQTPQQMTDNSPPFRGREYIPGSWASATWTEYWSTRDKAFQHVNSYRVNPKPEWRREPFRAFTSCRQMQRMLWQTFSTAACDHPLHDSQKPIKLGVDAAAVMGWKNDEEEIQKIPERFLICLTKGEPRIRWLATITSVFLGRNCRAVELMTDPEARVREVMLRTEDCCDTCALEQTAAIAGNNYWILIL